MASILDLGLAMQGSMGDVAGYVERQFRKSVDAASKKRDRLYGNLAYYFGNQIPDNIKSKLNKEDREAFVYNIAMRKIQGLVGALMRNGFDVSYMPIDGQNNSLYLALEDAFKADWNSGNCDYQWMQFLKLGCIEDAVIELTTSTRESPLGNLVFECTQPGAVVIDQNWRTNSSLDMTEAFKYGYYAPSQILALYAEMENELRDAIRAKLRDGKDYQIQGAGDNRSLWDAVTNDKSAGSGESDELTFNRNYPITSGGDYMVLQYQYLEPTKSKKEIDMKSLKELPDTGDIEYKKRWMKLQGVDEDYVREITYMKKVLKVVTLIPGLLQKPVQQKPHELQIERITFFPWSPERINGDTHSILDTLRPLNDVMNRRENQINNILENSANGAAAIDPQIVGNDPEKKKTIQDNWSNPRFKFWTEAGAISQGNKKYIEELPKSQPPNEIFAQINHLWDALDRVLPINAAADGRSESASESGILNRYKQEAIEVAQTTLVRGIMGIKTEMGDAYFRAGKTYYSDVEREFTRPDGTKFKVNEIIPLPDGNIGIRNDFSSLQNVKTLVKMSGDSPNSRFKRRMEALDTMRLVEDMPVVKTEVAAELFDTLDQNDDYRQRIRKAFDVQRQVALSNAKATIAINVKNEKQATEPPPQAPAQKPPSVSISYKDLSPEGQAQAAAQAGIQIQQQQAPQPGAQPGQPGGQQPPVPPGAPANPILQALAPLMKK